MKSLEQELLEIENFYKHCTPKEALAFFKAQSAKAFKEMETLMGEIKGTLKKIKQSISTMLKREKTRSCLTPMLCRTVTPARPYNMSCSDWLAYVKKERRYVSLMLRIQEEIAMEEILIQAQNILIKK